MNIIEYDRWLKEQIDCLKTRDFQALDIKNLIEELEALGRAEKSAIKSLTFQILIHLLLIDYWHEQSVYTKNHWQAEINSFKFQLADKLTTNYQLFLQNNLDKIYDKARTNAILKSNLPRGRFPENCPYSLEDIIN